jgi:hypothetical protein
LARHTIGRASERIECRENLWVSAFFDVDNERRDYLIPVVYTRGDLSIKARPSGSFAGRERIGVADFFEHAAERHSLFRGMFLDCFFVRDEQATQLFGPVANLVLASRQSKTPLPLQPAHALPAGVLGRGFLLLQGSIRPPPYFHFLQCLRGLF